MVSRRSLLALVGTALAGCATGAPQVGGGATALDAPKPRVVVTTDPELDDSNSLVRYLLYSTDFRTEGLVYASSQFHWKGDGTGKKWFVPGREYTRFGLNLCPCESWRWAPGERFIDDTYASYIRPNWPDIRALAAGQGGVGVGYGAYVFASAENAPYFSADWTRENVSSRGPLGARYRVWGDGKQMVKGDRFDYFGVA